jgi:uncharacterized damage-inducible protein DinB
MSGLDQVRALYAYNEWADGHVLDAASALSAEELDRKLGASFGSVQGNIWHALSAQQVWLGRWTVTAPQVPPNDASLATLRDVYAGTHAALRAFLASLDGDRLAGNVAYVDARGIAQQRPLWQTMLHVVNHGTHHRAETALLLTALGKPPRQLDYVFFELERAGGAPRLS